MTFLGAYAVPHDRVVWSGGLVTLLGDFGFSTGASRVALARMVRRGGFERLRNGRLVSYRPTPRTVALLEEGDRRIFSLGREPHRAELWTALWHAIPEERRLERARLARRLRFLGFGSVQDGMWISPHDREKEVVALIESLGVGGYAGVLVGRPAAGLDFAALASRAWDLDALDSRYRAFIDEFSSAAASARRARGVPAAHAARARVPPLPGARPRAPGRADARAALSRGGGRPVPPALRGARAQRAAALRCGDERAMSAARQRRCARRRDLLAPGGQVARRPGRDRPRPLPPPARPSRATPSPRAAPAGRAPPARSRDRSRRSRGRPREVCRPISACCVDVPNTPSTGTSGEKDDQVLLQPDDLVALGPLVERRPARVLQRLGGSGSLGERGPRRRAGRLPAPPRQPAGAVRRPHLAEALDLRRRRRLVGLAERRDRDAVDAVVRQRARADRVDRSADVLPVDLRQVDLGGARARGRPSRAAPGGSRRRGTTSARSDTRVRRRPAARRRTAAPARSGPRSGSRRR